MGIPVCGHGTSNQERVPVREKTNDEIRKCNAVVKSSIAWAVSNTKHGTRHAKGDLREPQGVCGDYMRYSIDVFPYGNASGISWVEVCTFGANGSVELVARDNEEVLASAIIPTATTSDLELARKAARHGQRDAGEI